MYKSEEEYLQQKRPAIEAIASSQLPAQHLRAVLALNLVRSSQALTLSRLITISLHQAQDNNRNLIAKIDITKNSSLVKANYV
jgi:hypothetical protein